MSDHILKKVINNFMCARTPNYDRGDKRTLTIYGCEGVSYNCNMENIDKVKDLIRRTWIVEIPNEGEVWFRNRGLDCRVVFSKAKVGWSRKPITTDRYVMVDAEMGEMFKFIKTFFSMEEDEVSVIRRFLMEWATEEHMKYISEKSNQEDNDSNSNDPT